MYNLPATIPLVEKISDIFSFEVKPHQILNDALAAIKATGGALMLVDQTGQWLEIWARLGPPHKRDMDPKFEIGKSNIAGWVAFNKKPYLSLDVTRDDLFSPTRTGPPNFRSLIAVPIFLGEQVVGVISADHEVDEVFSNEHIATMQVFADQMAAALAEELERTRLHETLISLHKVGTLLTQLSSEGSLSDVLERIADQARQVLDADVVTLYQYDDKNREFLVEGKGPTITGELLDPQVLIRTRLHPDDVAWKIVALGESRFFTNAKNHEFLIGNIPIREGKEPRPRFAVRERIESVAALILEVRAEIVGVMFVNYRNLHEFTDNERRILETFANYAAIAIQNNRQIEAILETQKQIVAAKQLAVLNSIAPTFAHKMSNAAGTIPVAVQEIRRKLSAPTEYVQFMLDIIEKDAKELLDMANQLRQGLGTGPLEYIDITSVLNSVNTDFSKNFPAITCHLNISTPLPGLFVARSQLQEVFLNLASNAAEAILPDHGQLVMSARVSEDDRFIEIEFADTGRGIRPEYQPRIFDLGFSTKPKRGLGFGLWWCRTFLRSQGGDIRLKSNQPGVGTSFIIQLPVSQVLG